MIALWMMYTVLIGTLLVGVASLAERASWRGRLRTRVIWISCMWATLLIPAVIALTSTNSRRVQDGPMQTQEISSPASVNARLNKLDVAVQWPTALRQYVSRQLSTMDAELSFAGVRLNKWNRLLLGAWALLSALVAALVAGGALAAGRARAALTSDNVAGVDILLADSLGPQAVGIRNAAIILPRWALELDDELLRIILRHESEHHDAHDPALLLAGLIAIILAPWDIPLWWAWRRLRLAIEVDCDARVLRTHPDIRRYAELLLLTGQRSAVDATRRSASWLMRGVTRPLINGAAPLQPQRSQLTRRISIMTQSQPSHPFGRAILFLGAAALAASVAFALPAPHTSATTSARGKSHSKELRQTQRVLVHLTSVGLRGVQVQNREITGEVLIWTTGSAEVGVGTAKPALVSDTLHLHSLPSITADVTDGDVVLQMLGPGTMTVAGDVTGGPALRLSATGRRIVLLKGGYGVRPTR